ncbi:MAG: hypothetical protein R2843_01495 [Thermomicrobiales bacterium]
MNRPDSLAGGIEARVTVDQLNLRNQPGNAAFVVASAQFGDRFDVAGPSQEVDGVVWWPIVADIDGAEQDVWVWSGGIEPAGTGFPGSIQEASDGVRRAFGDVVGWRP